MPRSSHVTRKFNLAVADADVHHKTLLDWSEGILDNIDDAAIKKLVHNYRLLASHYYRRYRDTLLDRLQTLHADGNALQTAVGDPANKEAVKAALEKAHQTLRDEYKDLQDQVPALMQEALDKLAAEWNRVYQVVVAGRANWQEEEHRDFMVAIGPVLKAAARAVGIDGDHITIVPQIGGDYSLEFFAYAGNLAVLRMPVFAPGVPWEWSVFWHELAGYRVRRLKAGEFDAVNQRLAQPNAIKRQLWEAGRVLIQARENPPPQSTSLEDFRANVDDLLDDLINLAANGLGEDPRWLRQFVESESYPGEDRILDFNEQLQAIKEALWARGPKYYEHALATGWSADWLEELFEDSFSTCFFQGPFIDMLMQILKRYPDGGKGLRHPPRDIRRRVGERLAALARNGRVAEPAAAEVEAETPASEEDNVVEELVAGQIHRCRHLLDTPLQLPDMAALSRTTDLFRLGSTGRSRHPVRPGESLNSVARQYNVPVATLVETNKLSGPLLTGQPLDIPGPRRLSQEELEQARVFLDKGPDFVTINEKRAAREKLAQNVQEIISNAMGQWLERENAAESVAESVAASAIRRLLDRKERQEVAAGMVALAAQDETEDAAAFIESWLENREYTELARIEFRDVDFLTTTIQDVACDGIIHYHSITVHRRVDRLLGSSGAVSFRIDDKQKSFRTAKQTWNRVVRTHPIP